MDYCILNGMKSTLVKGLLIQSLPMISKPLMRTSIDTIDGRDGDVVTKLGYAAYDKTMRIGLFGDFDIDEIIKFFDSEGTVIFSNEPDKFYRYIILNQIDFERLLRFRQADVVFHVQPFKFSAVDDVLTFSTVGKTSITLFNRGNVYSRPRLTFTGTGAVTLSINNTQVLSMTINEYITIDGEEMNAYKGTALANRSVNGDYNDIKLNSGVNTLSWTGSVSQIIAEKVSRWI